MITSIPDFIIESKDHMEFASIQEKLFEYGCTWLGGNSTPLIPVSMGDRSWIYVFNKLILWTDYIEHFEYIERFGNVRVLKLEDLDKMLPAILGL